MELRTGSLIGHRSFFSAMFLFVALGINMSYAMGKKVPLYTLFLNKRPRTKCILANIRQPLRFDQNAGIPNTLQNRHGHRVSQILAFQTQVRVATDGETTDTDAEAGSETTCKLSIGYVRNKFYKFWGLQWYLREWCPFLNAMHWGYF